MKLIIDIPEEQYNDIVKHLTDNDGNYAYSDFNLREIIRNGTPYNSSGDAISREAINSEIEKRYCSKHCVVPSEEPYCPDNCPARFLKNIVKECPTVPQVTVFAENADEKAVADMEAELQNVIDKRPNEQIAWEQGYEAGLAQGKQDNAQTVTPDKIQALMSDYLIYRCEPKRPQGKWELHGMIYYCSECGHDCGESGDNFCGNCGAEMRKGGTE